MDDLSIYPGGDLVQKGLADLAERALSEEALLVLVAARPLKELGFKFIEPGDIERPYEHRLYEAIESRLTSGEHAAYNALIQKVVSFVSAYRKHAQESA